MAKYCFYIVTICYIFSACDDLSVIEEISKNTPQRLSQNHTGSGEGTWKLTPIVLGEEMQIPYQINVMQEAYLLMEEHHLLQEARNVPYVPCVNAIYYRVLPKNSEELGVLINDTIATYSDVPYHHQLEKYDGDYYQDSSCDSLTWLYAVVSAKTPLPKLGTVEVLSELYIPEEREDVHEYEIDGVGVLEYLAYKLTYNLGEWEKEDILHYEEILYKCDLSKVGQQIDIAQLANGIQHSPQKKKAAKSLKAYPEGYYCVYNTHKQKTEGMNGVQVIIHNIVKLYKGTTDQNGHYKSTTVFRTKVWYQIRFYNEATKTSIFPLVPLAGSAWHRLGRHSKYGYDYNCYQDSKAWRFATTNNAIMKNKAFDEEYGVEVPTNLHIWMLPSSGGWSGSTPLLHRSKGAYHYIVVDILHYFGLPMLCLIVPDVMLFASAEDYTKTSEELSETIYHELAHASHYLSVGDSYWNKYITHIILHSGYGDDSSGQYAGYCGIGEMWGTYAGLYYSAKDIGEPTLGEIKLKGKDYWYNAQLMLSVGNATQDSHFTFGDMYRSLNVDVYTLDALQHSFIQHGADPNIINQLFKDKGGWK